MAKSELGVTVDLRANRRASGERRKPSSSARSVVEAVLIDDPLAVEEPQHPEEIDVRGGRAVGPSIGLDDPALENVAEELGVLVAARVHEEHVGEDGEEVDRLRPERRPVARRRRRAQGTD